MADWAERVRASFSHEEEVRDDRVEKMKCDCFRVLVFVGCQ